MSNIDNVETADAVTGEPGYFNKVFRLKKLESIFLFITSKCQSNCRTCFNHGNLNRDDDLTFEQIETISKTSGKFDKLWLSGGEPFLRDDMVKIIVMFYENNGIKSINLPSNGIARNKIINMTGELLEKCPKLSIYLNFSLDGLGKTHDSIRGVKGNFLKTVGTIEEIKKLYSKNKNLMVNVATVVTKEGYNEMLDLAGYVAKKNFCDLHIHEILRGEVPDPTLKDLSIEEVKSLNDKLSPVMDLGAKRLFKDLKQGKKIARLTYIGIMSFMDMIKEQNHDGPHHWGMNCTAGKTTFVIDANGDFRSCEMRPPIGNLKDYNFNLRSAYNSKAMQEEISAIGGGKKADCWCTHGCWISSSLKFSPWSMLVRLPKVARRKERLIKQMPPLPDVDIAAIEAAAKYDDPQESVKEAAV
ncbi:MAG: radical SAM protein [Deltaproteobacteria bacterium]|nr:radical SAM protein [Deltaproteobacteria bacterium]